jgi:hypothetical protein
MKITITLFADGAAFASESGGPGPEVARILHLLASRAEMAGEWMDDPDRPCSYALPKDINGNLCGHVLVTGD